MASLQYGDLLGLSENFLHSNSQSPDNNSCNTPVETPEP